MLERHKMCLEAERFNRTQNGTDRFWGNAVEQKMQASRSCVALQSGWRESLMFLFVPIFQSHAHTLIADNTRTKQRFGRIKPNFKSSVFRPARITILISLLSPFFSPNLCFLHSSLMPSIIHLILPPPLRSSYSISVPLHLSFITHCLTVIHSIHSALPLHILLVPTLNDGGL